MASDAARVSGHVFEHAVQSASEWLAEVAAQFGTDDRDFAYRVTRGWLHAVRDGLPMIDAAHLGAQLPTLLRGVYYDGWDAAAVPIKRNPDDFLTKFAADARVAKSEAPKILWAVSNAMNLRLTNLDKVLDHFHVSVRSLLTPG